MNKKDMPDKKARKQLRLTTAQFRNPNRTKHMQISLGTGYNTGKTRTAIQIQGLLEVPTASTEVSYFLPTSLPYIVGRLVGSCRWKMVIHAMSMLIGRAAISWSHPQTLGFKSSLRMER